MELGVLLSWSSVGPTLLFGLVFLIFYELHRYFSLLNKFPPGPKPWLLLGNLPETLKDPLKVFMDLGSYGEISTLYMGRSPAIVLNKLQIAKEALVHNAAAFSGRPSLPVLDWITNGNGIVGATYGHSWKQQRKFASVTLKNFGLGKKSLEERIVEEAHFLIEHLNKEGGNENPVDPQQVFQNAVSNIICSIVFGDRFEYTDKHFNDLLDVIKSNLYLTGSAVGLIFNQIPFIKHFPGPQQMIKKQADELTGFIRDKVMEHRKTLDRNDLRDFIDAYIVQQERQEMSPDSTFFEENMVLTVADLFLAGTDTTSTTLRWALIYMMEHPEIQERCHEEIISVLGFNRSPSMDNREDLPYVYATIHEVQRMANIAPMALPHQTTQATQLRGYHIPKGTDILLNLTSILTDKDQWKYPDTFNPENFLDEKGQFYKHEAFIVFSLGLRVCLGEQLARMEIFVFFTSLLQRLRFSWPPNTPPPDLEGTIGVVRCPNPYTMLCHSRAITH
ncbi:cytochrome P450 2J2-like [Osmerus mordax]|uniref:cytochrome P450 2J2-like n=1 Tax=Osmerus mordax TaxID=8014 RepID=UPI00350F1AC1